LAVLVCFEASEIVEVTVERCAGITYAHGFIETVARFVGLPVSKAQPTKLVSTRFEAASHVIAAAVLFDGIFALRAILCVCSKPVSGFRIIFALHSPLLHHFTIGGCVSFIIADKAETEATAALYLSFMGVFRSNCLSASRPRAPSKIGA